MISLVKDLKATYGINVKHARYNNTGENEDFKRACKQEGMGIQFEYTMPHTLQQNGQVKRKFATLFKRSHAMPNGKKFSSFLRNGL